MNHFAVQLKLIQHCKSSLAQLKIHYKQILPVLYPQNTFIWKLIGGKKLVFNTSEESFEHHWESFEKTTHRMGENICKSCVW